MTTMAKPLQVREATVTATPYHTRVVFELSKRPKNYRLFTLNSIKTKPRIVIDIQYARLAKHFNRQVYRKGLVKKLRSGMRKAGVLRLVLDLTQKAQLSSSLIKSKHLGNTYRLIVDLHTAKRRPVHSIKKTTVATASIKLPPKQQLIRNKFRRRANTHSALHYERSRDVIIAIDPGHGGDDPGAIGANGTREKDVVLKIAKHLFEIISREKGLRAILVRKGDYYVDLNQRRHIARHFKADLLISIHANSARKASARGISVYTLSQSGASSEAAKWLADRENRSDFIAGIRLQNNEDEDLAKVLLDLSQTSTLQASSKIARTVLLELKKLGKVHRGGLGKAGFVVLKSPDIPSILVETGFISNPREEQKLRSNSYQQRVAQHIFQGILHYFKRNAPPNTYFAALKKKQTVNTSQVDSHDY